MGKGIAKVFKGVYPEMFDRYQYLCETHQLTVGKLWLYKANHKWILNFPTKVNWRQPSKPEYIEAGLKKFASTYSQQGITSIAFPKLGCGNGELNWENTVRPLMERYLSGLAIDIFIYVRNDQAPHEHAVVDEMRRWLRTEPQTLAFATVWDDILEIVGTGLPLETSAHESFVVTITEDGDLLLRLRESRFLEPLIDALRELLHLRRPRILDRDKILVPKDCMLDLWQAIRGYGFCTARMMPAGLDILAPYLIPLLERLEYMTPVELTRRRRNSASLVEPALQLYAPPSDQLDSAHAERIAHKA